MTMKQLQLKLTQCMLIILCNVLVYGQSYENITKLRSVLLDGYNMDVRPVNNYSEVMNINISMTLYNLQEVDIVKGVITFTMSTSISWFDQRMVWNPVEYGGISKMHVAMKNVWTPLITLVNRAEYTAIGSLISQVKYDYDGLAVFSPGGIVHSSCNFNMKFWPFDKQRCVIGFAPLNYMKDEVQLHITSPAFNTHLHAKNSEWTLDGTTHYVSYSSTHSIAYFGMKLKRQSLFYILTVLLPMGGIGGLSGLVFLLPSDSGERVSFSVTILLAVSVFLTVFQDDLPKSSEPASLICILIVTGILTNSFVCLFVFLNLIIFYRNESVPKMKWCRLIVRISRCKSRKVGNVSKKKVQEDEQCANSEDYHGENDNNLEETKEEITWPDVSKALDKIMFYFLLIFGYAPFTLFIFYMSHFSEYPDS